jgi:excisionase family DNA binding protein
MIAEKVPLSRDVAAENAASPRVYLTVEEVAELLGVCTRSVFRWTRSGQLPKPLQLSKRCYRWRKADIVSML